MSSIQVSNLFGVNGIVAVITGGGTGIGLMMAKALAANGAAKVYIIGRREDKLKQAAASHPQIIIPLKGDVTSKDELKRMAEYVKQQTGYINLLITNAGITGPGLEDLKPRHTLSDFVAHAWASSEDDVNAVYNLNCTALYFTVIAFLELLDEGNKKKSYLRSQVIATASTASFLRNPRAGYGYLSSKAAVISLVKSFSTFCVPWSIRFNAIAAGLFPSELAAPLFNPFRINKNIPITEEGAFSKAYQPAERAGSEEDMAGTLLYMASRAGSFLNGSVVLVDGGKLATMPATY